MADVAADEFLEIGFAADEKWSTDTSELVRPLRSHIQRELLDVLSADELDFGTVM